MELPISCEQDVTSQLQTPWGAMQDVKRRVCVVIQSATLHPLKVMCTAWEVMLGDPKAVIKGQKELDLFGTMRRILEAKHKTVMEFVGLSLSIQGARLPYLMAMAGCRAGFSVQVRPSNLIDEPIADQMIYDAEVGCTFRALFDWIAVAKRSGVQDEHKLFAPLIASCVRTYDDYLGSILEGRL